MKLKPWQFTPREWLSQMRRPKLWVILSGLALLLALVDPFAAVSGFPFVMRPIYWLGLEVSCYSVGFLGFVGAKRVFKGRSFLSSLLAAITASSFVTLVVVIYNLSLHPDWSRAMNWPILILTIFAIALLVSLLLEQLFLSYQSENKTDEPPKLLQRLSIAKRGKLIALSAADHYVEVHTHKGKELVLMRLADAIDESAPIKGLKTHRSHWVALDEIKQLKREKSSDRLVMSNGAEIPVSRPVRGQLKKYGIR